MNTEPFRHYATAEAEVAADGRPVLYDCGLYADAGSIEAACTPEVADLVVIHIGGRTT